MEYQSAVMTQGDAAQYVEVDVTGAQELRLVVTDGDGIISCDHADWADPRLICGGDPPPCLPAGTPCDDGNPTTENDVEDGNCNCAGTPCPPAGTVCDDGNPLTSNDVEDGQCNCAGTPDTSGCNDQFLSSLTWASAPVNGWGPVEIDQSNGENAAGDGNPLTINGQTFSRGLGVHAYSEVIYNIGGAYGSFTTYIGVDDETCGVAGTVQFAVYVDGVMEYQSAVMTQGDAAQYVEVDVTGASELRLVVTDGNGNITCDHADWADPRLICGGQSALRMTSENIGGLSEGDDVGSHDLSVEIFPNPFDDDFQILVESPGNNFENATVMMYDIHGRVVMKKTTLPFDQTVVVKPDRSIPDGLYLVKIQSGRLIRNIKILKNPHR
jgi:hypothetical protein